ncbi:MAG: RNA polymerase Rbp10 [Nitrososphaeria archaeon]|jgi:DNA-directed RNA polymerase subunit P
MSEEGDIVFVCMRCGRKSSLKELEQLPEIKCICGYRVLRKDRPPLVRQVKAV